MPPSMICGSTGSCTSELAAPAGPLAVDVPVHEELRRHDVQPLADVLADAHHRLAAVRCRAGGVLGLVVVLDAAQMLGQRLALGWRRCSAWLGACAVQACSAAARAAPAGSPRPRPASPRTGAAARRSSPRSWHRTSSAFSRASSKVIFSSLASRHAMSRSCVRSACPAHRCAWPARRCGPAFAMPARSIQWG